jgi:hypothetical protein
MHTFKIGDLVTFGRPNGEQTEGKVVRVNTATLTIEQTEVRGQTRLREVGTKWRVPPSLVKPLAGGTAPKAARSEADLIAALRRVENALSPENLHWDGERSRAEARRAEAHLKAERRTLVAELGREPTVRELSGV